MALTNKEALSLSIAVLKLKSLSEHSCAADKSLISSAIDIMEAVLDSKKRNTSLTTNFSLEEFLVSPTAIKNNITLHPNEYVTSNLYDLCRTVLQPARDRLKSPIYISSGYRNEALNRIVGGVSNSFHLLGRAADISCRDNDVLYEILLKLPHSELIKYNHFIHVAL